MYQSIQPSIHTPSDPPNYPSSYLSIQRCVDSTVHPLRNPLYDPSNNTSSNQSFNPITHPTSHPTIHQSHDPADDLSIHQVLSWPSGPQVPSPSNNQSSNPSNDSSTFIRWSIQQSIHPSIQSYQQYPWNNTPMTHPMITFNRPSSHPWINQSNGSPTSHNSSSQSHQPITCVATHSSYIAFIKKLSYSHQPI